MSGLGGALRGVIARRIDALQSRLVSVSREEPKPRISSPPFISGDLFMANSDVAIIRASSQPIILRQANKEILFIESELVEIRRNRSYAAQFKAVVVHNGDHAPSQSAINDLVNSGVKLFATNTRDDESGRVFAIPIGIENAHLRRNGSIHYFNPLGIATTSLKKERDLLVSFSTFTNHAVRGHIEEKLRQAGYTNQKFSVIDYRRQLSRSRFVISPPGNGIDCHRTWEAFYHQTVPVVERRHWLFEGHKLPVLVVGDIDEFMEMSNAERAKRYEEIVSGPYHAIYWDYWMEFIKRHIS